MKGKELIKKAFNLQPVERAPWVPFVGVHAGKLIGVDAEAYLKSEENMFNGLSEVVKQYNPDGLPVDFDLQLEAEVLHCGLIWSKDNPPSVASHPMGEGGTETLADLHIPKPNEGRIGITLNLTRRLAKAFPDIALYGLITGPFTLALHLCGTDIFMNMFTDEQGVHDVMAFCTSVCKAMSSYYLEAGCDVVAVVDPMCSQIGPDQFNQFVGKYCSEVFDHIKKEGGLSSFFVCGQAKHNIEVMCACKPNNVSIDENIPLDYVRDTCLKNGISYGGNLKLTQVLLMGDVQDSERNVVECLDIAGKDYKGFILAPGCDLAYATPIENLVACGKIVRDTYQQDVIRAMGPKQTNVTPLDLDTYLLPNKVRVDCVTLDSSGCAACQYMWEAALRGSEQFGDNVIIKEHSIKTREGLDFMAASGVKDIPSILIDGKVYFSSNIPPIKDISEVIEKISKKK